MKLRIPPLDTRFDDIQCPYYPSISKSQNYVRSGNLKSTSLKSVALKTGVTDLHNLWAFVVG